MFTMRYVSIIFLQWCHPFFCTNLLFQRSGFLYVFIPMLSAGAVDFITLMPKLLVPNLQYLVWQEPDCSEIIGFICNSFPATRFWRVIHQGMLSCCNVVSCKFHKSPFMTIVGGDLSFSNLFDFWSNSLYLLSYSTVPTRMLKAIWSGSPWVPMSGKL